MDASWISKLCDTMVRTPAAYGMAYEDDPNDGRRRRRAGWTHETGSSGRAQLGWYQHGLIKTLRAQLGWYFFKFPKRNQDMPWHPAIALHGTMSP